MKKILISIFILFLSVSAFSFGGDDDVSTKCRTKYPVILVHGMGASGEISAFGINVADYWYGIPETLESEGAENVFYTSVNGMDTTANKAKAMKAQAMYYLASIGATKANFICHSHGTIYTRYAITNLGMSKFVASYTSLSGPHRGSAVADVIFDVVPNQGWALVGTTLDIIYEFIFGDTNPQSLANGLEMTRDYMQNTFNPNTPNISGIYYQSWTSKVRYFSNSIILEPTWLLLSFYEGSNDGLVSVTSSKWGNFRGVLEGAWWSSGLDHLGIVNQPLGITPGFDAPEFYIDMVEDLKNRGF